MDCFIGLHPVLNPRHGAVPSALSFPGHHIQEFWKLHFFNAGQAPVSLMKGTEVKGGLVGTG